MLIHGACHCGNLSFRLDWSPEPTEIPARACDCSFCVKHGGVWTSCPTGSLKVDVREAAALSNYPFGTRTADFHVCTGCGVVPVVSCRLDGRRYAVVNVNTFDDVRAGLLQRSTASFDGEDETDRVARRRARWIPDVEFIVAGQPC